LLNNSFGKMPTCLLLSLCLVSCISSQEIGAIPASLTIPDGTPIRVRLADSVSSAHARVGDPLDFVAVRDVDVGGFTVIPAGTVAQGSITGVQGKRLLGIGGNVTLKLDSVELINGNRVGLSASKKVKGGSRTKLMVAAMIATSLIFLPATPVFLLTRGHDGTVVKSTEITAHIDGPISILSAGLARSRESSSQLREMMDYLPPRVFSGEGREGDMVNLVFVAEEEDLQGAFERGGWVKTDKWRPEFVWHLARHGTKDLLLPMARFYLFGRVQDYAYALPDPNAVVSRRHHLRIWRTDYTVDGTPIWAGAATHDVAIEIAKHGRVINHRIDPAVDAERDFIGANLTETSSVRRQEYLHGTDPVFQAQTVSGEAYHSDSKILLLDLHPITLAKTGMPTQSSTIPQATSLLNAAPADTAQNGLPSRY
jgi:hypothetical protein